jgi:hypothetical protein
MDRFLSVLRKYLTVSFLGGLLLGVSGTALGATVLGSAKFSDVTPGSYYDQALGRLSDQKIVTGYPDGTFRPGQLVNRAEVVVMIDRAINGVDAGSETASSRPRRTSSSAPSETASTSSTPVVTSAGKVHFTTSGFNVGKETTRATITVVRTSGKEGAIKVDYAFGGGTAIANTDYSPATGTLAFADGETTKNISVTVTKGDSRPNRTLEVTLTNAQGGAVIGDPSKATLTLLGGGGGSSSAASANTSSVSGVGSFSFAANTFAVEENAGAISITVRRTNGSSSSATVNYLTSNGSGQSGTHYTSTQGTLNFAAGETSKTFSVQVTDNASIDGNRTVNLALNTPTGGSNIITPGSAVLTIIDNEATPSAATGSLVFSTTTYTVTEGAGTATVTVLRQRGNTGTVNVNYATSDGTATGAADYTPTSGTLTFAPGETSKSFSVPILKDTNTENEESINLSLSSVTGPATLGEVITATIKIQ